MCNFWFLWFYCLLLCFLEWLICLLNMCFHDFHGFMVFFSWRYDEGIGIFLILDLEIAPHENMAECDQNTFKPVDSIHHLKN